MKIIKPAVFRGAAWGTALTLMVAVLIIIGSRNLDHFDAALVAYTFATLFATFGVTYRYTMWLQRPPTKLYWKRGWQVFFRRNLLTGNIVRWVKRLVADFALNHFIFKRGSWRWLAHSSLCGVASWRSPSRFRSCGAG